VTQESLVYIIGTGVVGALTTVVGVLWKRQEKYQEQSRSDLLKAEEKTRADLLECRIDRQRIWEVCNELKMEIIKLGGCNK
jgi:hypothetical protein